METPMCLHKNPIERRTRSNGALFRMRFQRRLTAIFTLKCRGLQVPFLSGGLERCGPSHPHRQEESCSHPRNTENVGSMRASPRVGVHGSSLDSPHAARDIDQKHVRVHLGCCFKYTMTSPRELGRSNRYVPRHRL